MNKPIEQYLDSTYLNIEPDSAAQVRNLCHDAAEYAMRAVCVRPEFLSLARDILSGTSVGLATVIAFPTEKSTVAEQRKHHVFGREVVSAKVRGIQEALEHGATELDVVLSTNYYSLPECEALVREECQALVEASQGLLLKLIFECDLLCPHKLALVVTAALDAGVPCLKTSTGFLGDGQGATPSRISQLRTLADASGREILVKASGGVRNYEQAKTLLDLGADIIGTSAAKSIILVSRSC
jgi:deoxyribose-phosphate aldolase